MIAFKIEVIVVVTVIIINLSLVGCWFERSNYRIDLESNAVFPLKSLPYQAGTSTRVAFVGKRGDRLSLVCNINFSEGCGRRSSSYLFGEPTRRRGCCDDYFYVGYDLDRNIRGAERWCGKRTIRKNSRRTSGRPVLVVATSATRWGRFGKYKCYISSVGNSAVTTTRPTPTTGGETTEEETTEEETTEEETTEEETTEEETTDADGNK